jgi:hypothetical protein
LGCAAGFERQANVPMRGGHQSVRAAWCITFMFMTAWVFEAHHCPALPNEIKKTKLQIYTSPQAGINILLAVVGLLLTLFKAVSFVTRYVTPIFINQSIGAAFFH